MKLPYYLLQILKVQMRVYFGSSNAFMPEHFLNQPQVCPTLQQMGGKAVPESMRTDGFPDAGHISCCNHDLENGNSAQVFSLFIKQKMVAESWFYLNAGTNIFQIFPDAFPG